MDYRVRKFKKSDLETLSSIMKECFYLEPWKEVWKEEECLNRLKVMTDISTSFSFVLVDENDQVHGAAIGFLLPFMDKMQYELQEFFVDVKLQHFHLGTFMMNELLKEIKKEKVDEVLFYTSGHLDKFYGKFGFRKDDTRYLMYMDDYQL